MTRGVVNGRWTRSLGAVCALALTAVAVASCGDGSPAGSHVVPSAVRIATHRDLGGGPGAIVGGRLTIVNGCLAFEWIGGGESQVAVWPRGASVWEVDGETVVAGSGKVAAVVGGEAFFGGGMDFTFQALRDLVDTPIPAECQADSYMLINDLDPLPRP